MEFMGHLNAAVKALDVICSRIQLRLGERRGGLITFFVHNLFLDAGEIERGLACPQQCLTLGHLERAIEYFQSVGYRFVSPAEVIAGLDPNGRHVLLTFDDGYFNRRIFGENHPVCQRRRVAVGLWDRSSKGVCPKIAKRRPGHVSGTTHILGQSREKY